MSDFDLKSYRFRAEREHDWRQLEALLNRVQEAGPKDLDRDELLQLPQLYRTAVSSLSTARAVSLDRNLIAYLEGLCTRGYLFIHGPRVTFWQRFTSFFRKEWPESVYSLGWATLLSTGITAGFALIAFLLVLADPEWFYPFAAFMDSRTPDASVETLRETIYTDQSEWGGWLSVFASQLFTHNTMIALFCFALGFMVGIPTAILLAYNGCILGAYVALFYSKGLGYEFVGWLLIHGVTELLAIILAGAAGIHIGKTLAFPGKMRRVDAMAKAGRMTGNVAMGCVLMLLLAAVLEGFGRQMINDDTTRYLIAAVSFLGWMSYFYLLPRRAN